MTTTHFGVDLITFYHPTFWGLESKEELLDLAQRSPETVWIRIMDSVVEAGLDTLELTFPPADWHSAVAAFGSAEGFRRELDARGLRVKSGFMSSRGWDLVSAAEFGDRAAEYADFVRRAGGDTIVVGPPMRRSWDANPPLFVDLPFMQRFADHLHHAGAATLHEKVRTAVHTEAHSTVCTTRDVDLLMAITDPMYVFLCPDTGHLALSGSEPTFAASHHRERMIICHWKDAIGEMPRDVPIDDGIHEAHRDYFRRVGAGNIDWTAWSALVDAAGFAELTLLELDAVPDPISELRAARLFVEDTLGKTAA